MARIGLAIWVATQILPMILNVQSFSLFDLFSKMAVIFILKLSQNGSILQVFNSDDYAQESECYCHRSEPYLWHPSVVNVGLRKIDNQRRNPHYYKSEHPNKTIVCSFYVGTV